MALIVDVLLTGAILVGLALEITLTFQITNSVSEVRLKKSELERMKRSNEGSSTNKINETTSKLLKAERHIVSCKNCRKIIGIFVCLGLVSLMLLNRFSFMVTFFIGGCLIIWVCCWIIGIFDDE